MVEELIFKWNELIESKQDLASVGGKDARNIQKAKIALHQKQFDAMKSKASADDVLLLLGIHVDQMRDAAIQSAREKGNTWRETARLLGEADAFDEVGKLITEICLGEHGTS